MSIRSTSLEPKSQHTINLALKRKQKKERKFPIKECEKAKKKENSQSKSGRKQKRKKVPDQGSEEKEICRKVFGPDNI